MTHPDKLRMQDYGDNLWTVEGDQVRMYSIPFGTRMTVIRLEDGGLWIHSPVAPNLERLAFVNSLGAVKYIVAPNKFHHLYVQPWKDEFPHAQVWAEANLARRFDTDLYQHILDPEQSMPWQHEIEQQEFLGSKALSEVVFLHRPSRTLIVTDIIQNHDPQQNSFIWRAVKGVNGILAPNGGAPRDWRISVRDKAAARTSAERILKWDFDRIVLSHGICIESDGHAYFQRAFRWLIDE